MIQLASLDFVEGDNDSLEEVDVLLSEGDSKSGNNGSKNVKKFSSTIEFIVLMNEGIEGVGDSLSDELSSGNDLGIESVKDIF